MSPGTVGLALALSALLLWAPGELGPALGGAPRWGPVTLVWLALAGLPGLRARGGRAAAGRRAERSGVSDGAVGDPTGRAATVAAGSGAGSGADEPGSNEPGAEPAPTAAPPARAVAVDPEDPVPAPPSLPDAALVARTEDVRAGLRWAALALPALAAAQALDGLALGSATGPGVVRLLEAALLVGVLRAAARRATRSNLAQSLYGAYWLLVIVAVPLVVTVGQWGPGGGARPSLSRLMQASPLGWAWSGGGGSPAPLLLSLLALWLAGLGDTARAFAEPIARGGRGARAGGEAPRDAVPGGEA